MWKSLKYLIIKMIKQPRRHFLALVLTVVLLTVDVPAWANVNNSSGQPYAQTPELIRQAQQDYGQGQFQQAVNALETAIDRFDSNGESLQKAIALSNLSLAYQGLRNWSDAQIAIEESLQILGVSSEDFPLELTSELEQPVILASALDIYGQLWQQQGDFATAVTIWQQAAALHQTTGNAEGWLGSQINQIRALEALGLYQQARVKAEQVGCALGEEQEGSTCSVSVFTQDAIPSDIRLKGLRSLGDTLRQVGELELSKEILDSAYTAAETMQERQSLRLSLGNTYEAIGTRAKERNTSDNRQGIIPWRFIPTDEIPDEAKDSYKEAETYFSQVLENNETSTDCPSILPKTTDQIQLTAAAMCLSVRLEQNLAEQNQDLWNSLYGRIIDERMPNRTLVYTAIRLAKQGAYLNQMMNADRISWDRIIGLLHKAINDAEQLQDKPAESYARGNLGGLYEYFDWVEKYEGQQLQPSIDIRTEAEAFTQKALLLAQPSTFPEIAYQWQWQLARLTLANDCVNCSQAEKQALTSKATSTYEQAIGTLEQVREGLLSVNADVQFSFRDNIEPIYRELVDLKLQADNPSQDDLQEVVNLIDKLQISELESFLRCRLTPTKLEKQDIDPHAAVLYPIILRDRMEVILALPNGSLHRRKSSTQLDRFKQKNFHSYIDSIVNQFRQDSSGNLRRRLRARKIAASLYEQLIKTFEFELETQQNQAESNIKTLVFVLDGALRNFPMSALLDSGYNTHTENRYLIERYAIAISPTLKIFDSNPLSKPIKVLLAGSDKAFKDLENGISFGPLPFVKKELEGIENLVKNSEKLFNLTFNRNKLIEMLSSKQFSIVHLATHGQFSSDPQKTFIVLADSLLYANELDRLLKASENSNKNIELLVLSACQTAEGDKRAVLGMAGLAIRAGASSTLSTLWPVNDESAATLIQLFYQELLSDNAITKAEALRRAQLKLKEIGTENNSGWQSTYHWAPFTVVGNWR